MCLDIIQNSWSNNRFVTIQEKLENCKAPLTAWGREIIWTFKERISMCKKTLRMLRGKRDEDSINRYKETQNKLAEIYLQKEIYWRQRSKQLWLQFGDRNTKYFHTSATNRKKNNTILKLQDDSGSWKDRDDGLHKLIEDYFSDIFSTVGVECEGVLSEVQHRISENQNNWLLEEIRSEEVKAALFSMSPDKAHGLDGYTPGVSKSLAYITQGCGENSEEFFCREEAVG